MTTVDRDARRFRRWLWLFPGEFRRRYADDMTACFIERVSERPMSRAAWRRTVFDLMRNAFAEWRGSSLRRPADVGRPPSPKGDSAVKSIWYDLLPVFRSLRRQPGYTAFVTLTLAVGIGASVSVFSVVNGVLLTPLPYAQSDRLLDVSGRFLPESGFDFDRFALSTPEFLDYRSQMTSLEDVAAYRGIRVTVGALGNSGGDPERVIAYRVTPGLFPLLKQDLPLGRAFVPDEGRPGSNPTVVLSDDYWRGHFGGDPAVLGQTLMIDGMAHTVVGVAQPGFAFPNAAARLWLPMVIDPASPGGRSSHGITAIARMKDSVSIEQVAAETEVLMAQWKADYPDIHTGHFLYVTPALEATVGSVADILWPLLAATVLLLFIVCANVSSVTLARAEARAREMALRTALGAGRWRLARMALTESAVLSLLGAMGGLAIAWVGVRVLVLREGTGLPRLSEIAMDWRVALFGIVLAAVSSFIVGVMPALKATSRRPSETLREDTRTSTTGRLRARKLMVVAEVALTVVLVTGAGLMVRSLVRVVSMETGFESRDVVLAALSLPEARYGAPDQVYQFFDEVLARVGASPGVSAISAANSVPFYQGIGFWDFQIEGRPPVEQGQPALNAGFGAMRVGFTELLGIPLERGRTFTTADRANTEAVVIINDTLAIKYFPNEDPIGRRLRVSSRDPLPWMRIVGVIGSVRDGSLESPPGPKYYVPHEQMLSSAQSVGRTMAVVMKVNGDPAAGIGALRRVVRDMDADLPVAAVQTMDAALGDAGARRRFATTMFGGFALIGLMLGATGIYGVLAYLVSQRTKEIGIRRALGASSQAVVSVTLQAALWPVVVGLAVGLTAAVGASRWIEGQLFGVTPTDAATYGLVIVGVCVVALVASLIPLRRALRIDPAIALHG